MDRDALFAQNAGFAGQVGAQLQGPAFADASLLTFARALERACSMEGTVAPAFRGKGGEL